MANPDGRRDSYRSKVSRMTAQLTEGAEPPPPGVSVDEVEIMLNRFRLDNLKLKFGGGDDEGDDPSPDGTAMRGALGGAQRDDPDERVKREKLRYGVSFIRETLIFILFLTTFCLSISEFVAGSHYYYVSHVRSLFVDPPIYPHIAGAGLDQISTREDVVLWLRQIFLPQVFSTDKYNGDVKTPYEQRFMPGGNRVLGPVRIRQVRSSSRCRGASIVRELMMSGECIGDDLVVAKHELRGSFGEEWYLNNTRLTDADAWGYVTAGDGDVLHTEPTRYQYRSLAQLCAEAPDPRKSMSLDLMARQELRGNKGLRFYCELQTDATGLSGAVYPNGGYAVDLPPTDYYTAFADNLYERASLLQQWNREHAPAPGDPLATAQPTAAPTPVATAGGADGSSNTTVVSLVGTLVEDGGGGAAPTNQTATLVNSTATGEEAPPGPVLPAPPTRLQYSLDALGDLVRHKWLTNNTALVSVEFTVYNANIDMILCGQFLFECLPTGGVRAFPVLRPLTLPIADTYSDKLTFACELALCVFIVYYLLEDGRKVYGFFSTNWRHCQVCCLSRMQKRDYIPQIPCRNCQEPFNPFHVPCCPSCYYDVQATHVCWRGYFRSVWNLVDFLNLVILIIVLVIKFKLRMDVRGMSFRDETQFLQLFPVARALALSQALNSMNVVLMFVKTMKYVGRVKALSTLVRTLANALVPTAWFLVLFALLYTGFMYAFHLSFASDVYGYRDPSSTLMSQFRMALGVFEYHDLEEANQYIAPVLFVLYNTTMVLVVANIFISIIEEAYGQARWEIRQGRTDYLNSALKLIAGQLTYKWQSLTGTRSTLVDKFELLVKGLYAVPHLVDEERSLLRIFLKDTVEGMDVEMMYEVLMAFQFNPKRVMRLEDYKIFNSTVEGVKKARRAETTKGLVWDDDGEDTTAVDKIIQGDLDDDELQENLDILAASGVDLPPDVHLRVFKQDAVHAKKQLGERNQLDRRARRLNHTVDNIMRRLDILTHLQNADNCTEGMGSPTSNNSRQRLMGGFETASVDSMNDGPTSPTSPAEVPSPPIISLTVNSPADPESAAPRGSRGAQRGVGVFSMAQGASMDFEERTPPQTPPPQN